ncbi:MFS transporter [Nocardia vinacea]|uniref:MFS transporter n=1 Tax=Nocardia vinacea TaxID=96468 RepID=A0ABZ1Z769_9NOCA|nr:MFS transporter [Nocardia vinacea]
MTAVLPSPPSTPARARLEVLVCVCAGFATLLDSSVLGITVPALRAGLRADAGQVQWLLASYSLTFGLALVPAGRLGDVLGRRRLFLAGIAVFAVSAVCAALANGPWPVVAARLCQGAGAGVISSQVLGIIADRYTGVGRAKALAAYGVAAGLAGMVGPITAGAILGAAGPDLGWRLVLLLNVPFALLTLVGGAVLLRRDRTVRGSARFDAVGLVMLAAATLLLLLPMVSSAGRGRAVVCVAGSLAMLAVFWWWERRYARSGGAPVLLPALAAARGYTLGTAVAMFWFGAIVSLNTVMTLYLVEGLGLGAVQAALVMVGGSVMMALASGFGWRIVTKFGRMTVVCALVLQCGVVTGYIVAVEVIPRPAVFFVVALLAAASGTAGGFVDAPNRAMTLEYAPNGANGVAAGFLQLAQRLSATVALTGVSGLYLAATGSRIGGAGHAISPALTVCLAMVVLSLVCAVADLRRRSTDSESR